MIDGLGRCLVRVHLFFFPFFLFFLFTRAFGLVWTEGEQPHVNAACGCFSFGGWGGRGGRTASPSRARAVLCKHVSPAGACANVVLMSCDHNMHKHIHAHTDLFQPLHLCKMPITYRAAPLRNTSCFLVLIIFCSLSLTTLSEFQILQPYLI